MGAIVAILSQFVQLAVLGRLLDPADFGLMAIVMIVIGLLGLVADMGVSNFIVHTKNLSARALGSLLMACAALSSLFTIILLFLSSWIAVYYHKPLLAPLLSTIAFLLVGMSLSQIYFAHLQRELRFKEVAIGDMFANISGVVIGIAFAINGKGVWSLVAAQWGVILIKTGCFAWISSSICRPRFSWNPSDLTAPLHFGSFQVGERLLNYLGWNIDKLIIGKILGEASLGVYSVAYQLVIRPFSALNPIFTRVAFPLFSRKQDDNPWLCRGYLKLTRTIALITFPIYIFIVVSGDAIVYFLMGPKWEGAGTVLRILGLLGFIFTLGNPIGTLLLAKGRVKLGFYYNVVAAVIYIAFVLIGINFGLQGAAWGLVIAAAGILFPFEFLLRWHLVGMRPGEYINAIRMIVFAAFISIILSTIASDLVVGAVGDALLVRVVTGIFALAVYGCLLFLFENKLIRETYQLTRLAQRAV